MEVRVEYVGERHDDAGGEVGVELRLGHGHGNCETTQGVEHDGEDAEHDHDHRVDLAGVLQLVHVRGGSLDAREGEDERCEDDQRAHLREVRDDAARVKVQLRDAARGQIRDQADQKDDGGNQHAAEEADLGYAGGELGAAKLREREHPYDNRHADEHDERIIVECVPSHDVRNRGQDEERHGHEADRDLEPLVEQGRETPALAEGVADPGIDATVFPSFNSRHLGGDQCDREEPEDTTQYEEEDQMQTR